jgi:hypothetical protein
MINEKFQVVKVKCDFDSSLNFTAAVFENDSQCQIEDDTEEMAAWWVSSPLCEKIINVSRETFFRITEGAQFGCDQDDHDWAFLEYGGCTFDGTHFSRYRCSVCGKLETF